MKTTEAKLKEYIMGIFGTAPAANAKVEKEIDFNKRTVDTGVYEGIIKMAFAGQSAGGARFITLQLKLSNGKDYSETIYVSNKAGSNTYTKEVNGETKEFYLPGFLLMNNIAVLATGRSLHDLAADVETRTVKLYDFDAKAEVPQDVPAIIPLLNQKVLVAIQEEEYAKSKYNESTKKYENTGDYGVKNTIIKAYDLDTRKTPVELRDGKDATQLDSWLAANNGKLKTVEREAAPANQKSAPTASGLF